MNHFRRAAAAALIVLLVACSSANPASETTTTTTTTWVPDGGGSTTTTTTEPELETEGFRTRTPGVLVVGTERLISPWYTGPSPDEITGGVDYRLAREIGSRLGVPVVKIVRTSLVLMMTGQDCGCDLIISGVTITDGRARTLDLTEPYVDADQALVVRQGVPVATMADAALLRLGAAVRDPTALDVIRNRLQPVAEPTIVVDEQDAVRRVLDGRLDGVLMDVPDALALAAANPSLAIAGKIRTGEQYAVALSLGSPNTALVNDVIRQLRGDGTIANLLTAYLGAQPSDIAVLPP